jgi:hypothetical protein
MSRIISKPFEAPLAPAIIIDSSVPISVPDGSSQPFVQKPKEFVYVPPKDSGEAPAFTPMISAQPLLTPKVDHSDAGCIPKTLPDAVPMLKPF